MPTVLIVDSDLGFVAFLSQSLTHAGYMTLPAIASQNALPLLDELENPKVDLLMVNFSLSSTAALAAALKEKNPLLKVISLEDPRGSPVSNITANASLRKSSPDDFKANEYWRSTVNQILSET